MVVAVVDLEVEVEEEVVVATRNDLRNCQEARMFSKLQCGLLKTLDLDKYITDCIYSLGGYFCYFIYRFHLLSFLYIAFSSRLIFLPLPYFLVNPIFSFCKLFL